MNRFYKYIISLLFLADFLIIYGILLSVFFNKTGLIMTLTFAGYYVLVIWSLLFFISLLGLMFYRHRIIPSKIFIVSIVVIILNYYLTYLCQFTHTPDIFSYDDFVRSTKRFILYFPKEYYWAIFQVISFIVSILVKDKKNLKGLKINLIISFIRSSLLFFCIIIYILPMLKDDFLRRDFDLMYFSISPRFQLFLVYFIVSCIIEFGIDFIIKKCSKVSLK